MNKERALPLLCIEIVVLGRRYRCQEDQEMRTYLVSVFLSLPLGTLVCADCLVYSPLGDIQGVSEGQVRAIASYQNKIYVGGDFTSIGGVDASGLAVWDGMSWSAMPSQLSEDSPDISRVGVYAMAVYDGELVVAGEFTIAGSISVANIAAWNGTAWSGLGHGLLDNPAGSIPVHALAVSSDGTTLYAGGEFLEAVDSSGPVTVNHVAQWNKWNGLEWEPLLGTEVPAWPGVNDNVYALHYYNNRLYIGGEFIFAGNNIGVSGVVRWNSTTGWSKMGLGSHPGVMFGPVRAFAYFGGWVYVGGDFTKVINDGAEYDYYYIAKFAGNQWYPVPGIQTSVGGALNNVRALIVHDDGSGPALFAGGDFDQFILDSVYYYSPKVAKFDGTSWNRLGLDGYVNRVDGPVYALCSDSTLYGMNMLFMGGLFEYVGPTQAEGVAMYGALNAPQITAQPQGQQMCPGGTAVFSVTAEGSMPVYYQWQKNGSNLSDDTRITGSQTSSLTITSSVTGDSGSYRVVVTKDACTITSDAAVLTVYSPPVITVHPTNASICLGETNQFSVEATGYITGYQWQIYDSEPWHDIPGANASSYSTPTSLAVGSYDYRCKVTGCGTTTSSSATLTVRQLTEVTVDPQPAAVCQGENVTFTVSANGYNRHYQWKKRIGATQVDVGTDSSTLNIYGVQPSDAAFYSCVVSGQCGTDTSEEAELYVKVATQILAQPQSTSVCQGDDAVFSVTASGEGTPQYQWYRVQGIVPEIITGAISDTLTISPATTTDAQYMYYCRVTAQCGSVSSSWVSLTVNIPVAITLQPQNAEKYEGQTAVFYIAASGSSLSYQWQYFNDPEWQDVSTGAGAQTNRYTTEPLTIAHNERLYRCRVTNLCNTLYSESASVRVTRIIYVNQNASGVNDGTSWTDAYLDLQDALADATDYAGPDEIWVAMGTYVPDGSDKGISFSIPGSMKMYGGFAGGETTIEQRSLDPNVTVLSGDLLGDDGEFISAYDVRDSLNRADNSYTVVTCIDNVEPVLIDGFTIKGGHAKYLTNPSEPNEVDDFGGGLYCRNSDIDITNCLFRYNAAWNGGSVCYRDSSSQIHDCSFLVSYAMGGGAIYASEPDLTIQNCNISGNTSANMGGGLSLVGGHVGMDGCSIQSNESNGAGAGIRIGGACHITVNDTVIRYNSASSDGGGLWCGSSTTVELTDSCVTHNSAASGGGVYGMGSLAFTNALVAHNSASAFGGGIFCSKNADVANATIASNDADDGGGMYWTATSEPNILNTIVWDNEPNGLTGVSAVVNYSDIQGANDANYPGGGNISQDPLFASSEDYHLRSFIGRWDAGSLTWAYDLEHSPCIDGGDPASDWSGELWPHGKRVNMGIYGGTHQASLSDNPVCQAADYDCDGIIDFGDYSRFADEWVCQEQPSGADLPPRDGFVDYVDLALFVEQWLNEYVP